LTVILLGLISFALIGLASSPGKRLLLSLGVVIMLCLALWSSAG
jgi:hypothetical protein